MKHLNLTKNDDITAVPSDELNRTTISAMRAKQAETDKAAYESVTKELPLERIAENERVKKVRLKKIITCAAAACAAVFLMGMGARVFEYLTYVPGMGIVTAEQEEVYTLESVVEAGKYRIEAMSLIPATEEYHKGMWEVTILTDMEVPKGFHENPDLVDPIVFTDKNGESYSLKCSGGSGIGARFRGYVNAAGEGDHTISWYGGDYTVTLKSMENSVWANYAYPMDQGLTVITFPLAENSQYMVFDVILNPESENLMYWAEHSDTIAYQPHGASITVYDTAGNTYHAPARSGSSAAIPETEKANGINSLLSYRIETILTLDRVMEAPIAKVEVGGLLIEFRDISGTGFCTTVVPELGEVVEKSELPKGGVLFDSHGIKAEIDSTTSVVDEINNTYDFVMNAKFPAWSFDENVVGVNVMMKYIKPENIGIAKSWEYYFGSGESMFDTENPDSGYMIYSKDITGYGDRKIRDGSIGVTFGDEIAVSVGELWLTLEGEWLIDFTEPAKAAE